MHTLGHTRSANWVLKLALVATVALVATEFVAGALAGSLALLSDGWHNFTDVPTLLLTWIALYFAQRPPDQEKTFGYHRAGVLAAFVNGLLLVGVAVFICYEGYQRILHPAPVAGGAMLAVGFLALVINGGITLALARERRDLNLRAVFIHNLGDALSNLAIIAGGWLIRRTGQTFIDPVIAFLIAGMIVWSAVGILLESSNILLESTPKGMSVERVAVAMLEIPGVREVHDVHIWSLGSESHALACHIRILDMPTSESERIAHRVRAVLASEFGITHTTIQFEHTHAPGDFHRYMPEPAPASRKTEE
ncbi:MAG: cation diffusion facilitator family transporter [Acidobacteriia bacterium]|nr:cation diffusion facilitator family transporter [Terriglobia bacterium]